MRDFKRDRCRNPGVFSIYQPQAGFSVKRVNIGQLRVDGLGGECFCGDGEPAFRADVL